MKDGAVRAARRLAGEAGGAVAVEFALVSVAFVSLLVGVCLVGLMAFSDLSLEWAVARGVRAAEIDKTATQSQVSTAINTYLHGAGLPNATVTYTTSMSGGVQFATIGANFTRSYTIPMLPTFSINFTSSAVVPQPG